MAENEKQKITQRRVYVLPTELVERIEQYQKDKGLASEVEAVRRLLDDSLKSRDTYGTVVRQFLSKFSTTRILSEATKDVLVGHPLITSIAFGTNSITFEMSDQNGGQDRVVIYDNETVEVNGTDWPPPKARKSPARQAQAWDAPSDFDDEIPF